ncbi:MAG: hypothetical protein ACTMUB_08415 [cyanobacterium endosymbiont of Rhopalodia musculus]
MIIVNANYQLLLATSWQITPRFSTSVNNYNRGDFVETGFSDQDLEECTL